MNTRTVNGIATVVIGGKDYVTCHERIKQVHAASRELEVVESQPFQVGDRWVWRAVIVLDKKRYVGNAEIHLNGKPGSADATDPFATAETSAVARALAWAGYSSPETIASADELTRGTPHVTVVESANPQITTSQHPHAIQTVKAGLSDTRARLNTIYAEGKRKCGWSSTDDMALFIAYALDRQITADMLTGLSAHDLDKIAKPLAHEQEPAHTKEEEVAA